MKASEVRLLEFLKKSSQFVIPVYQRTYSWTEQECRQLWDDVLRSGSDKNIQVHFIGSIVYVEDGLYQVSHQTPLQVIDGQQRLTTVLLLLAALAETLDMKDEEPFDGFSALKIRKRYLVDEEENGDRRYKLLLSQNDKATLTAIMEIHELPDDPSIRVKQNFELFKTWIAGESHNLASICKGLVKLVIVDLALNRDQDNPQLIFESMNSTGRALSQADLIRNFVLMGLAPELQQRLYEQYWRPMEVAFGQEAYNQQFDAFMRYYLTVQNNELPNKREVYETFKRYAGKIDNNEALEILVRQIRDYARYYCAMALDAETDQDLKYAFRDLRELKANVAYPLLLELYHDYATGILPKHDFIEIVRMIESYVFRRVICAIPTASLNKTFASFTKGLNKNEYLENIKAGFLSLTSIRRFPQDHEFKRNFRTHDLYNFRSRDYWLRRFENFGRKERVAVEDYTIEHIMPQNLSPAWESSLGFDCERIHEEWLHTSGNLTLTGYNSEYGNRSFQEKRDMDGGFKTSPLRVNEGLGKLNQWNEDSIKERAHHLAESALDIWKYPDLPNGMMAIDQSARVRKTYVLQDHPKLLSGALGDLFIAFRREILGLDPCVTEVFRKQYVAYLARKNFVDLQPMTTEFRLMLNMRFTEISDPKRICKDVSNIGHLGNGDVEVRLREIAEIPYVMGLVRQSFERQYENDDAEHSFD